jgi:hypothetical protein
VSAAASATPRPRTRIEEALANRIEGGRDVSRD